VWEFTEIKHSRVYEMVVDESKSPSQVPEWFPGARLNLAENMLWPNDDHTAVIATGEGHPVSSVSYRELREKVAACAAALRASGVVPGDRVVGNFSSLLLFSSSLLFFLLPPFFFLFHSSLL